MAKTEEEWRAVLSPEEFEVLRNKKTEMAFTGEYTDVMPPDGYFSCRACGNALYSAAAKFDSGCGWPAFDKSFPGAIRMVPAPEKKNHFEIVCERCDGHLGHLFRRRTSVTERHCVNSISVKYVKGEAPHT